MKEIQGDVFTQSEALEVFSSLLSEAGEGSPKLVLNGHPENAVILIRKDDLKALLRQDGAPTIQAQLLQLFYKVPQK